MNTTQTETADFRSASVDNERANTRADRPRFYVSQDGTEFCILSTRDKLFTTYGYYPTRQMAQKATDAMNKNNRSLRG